MLPLDSKPRDEIWKSTQCVQLLAQIVAAHGTHTIVILMVKQAAKKDGRTLPQRVRSCIHLVRMEALYKIQNDTIITNANYLMRYL